MHDKKSFLISTDHVKDADSIKCLRRLLSKIFSELKQFQVLEIDLSNIDEEYATYQNVDQIIRPFLCRKSKKSVMDNKHYVLCNPKPAVKRMITAVLNKYGIAGLVKENGKVSVLGSAVMLEAKNGSYVQILKEINERGYITTKELSDILDIKQSLACYKLEKLYRWSLINKQSFKPTRGGRGYVYLPINIKKELWTYNDGIKEGVQLMLDLEPRHRD